MYRAEVCFSVLMNAAVDVAAGERAEVGMRRKGDGCVERPDGARLW